MLRCILSRLCCCCLNKLKLLMFFARSTKLKHLCTSAQAQRNWKIPFSMNVDASTKLTPIFGVFNVEDTKTFFRCTWDNCSNCPASESIISLNDTVYSFMYCKPDFSNVSPLIIKVSEEGLILGKSKLESSLNRDHETSRVMQPSWYLLESTLEKQHFKITSYPLRKTVRKFQHRVNFND